MSLLLKRRFIRLFSISILLLATCPLSVAERRERLIESWRPVHYEVSLVFDDKLTQLTSARTELTIEIEKDEVSLIDMDFGDMRIDSVRIDAMSANYIQKDGKLFVTLAGPSKKDERLKIAIEYHGRPKDGLILSTDKDGKPSVTGDNWPDRVHHWIPTLDHPSAKATVRFTVTAPARDLVVANGRLESTLSSSATTRTWVWNESVSISPYCMIVAVGQFARLEAKDQSITPLSYYVPQSDRRFAMQGFAPAAPSLKYFSEIVGEYPYEKLAMIVGATTFGGMENSSAIVFGSGLFNDFQTKQPRSKRFHIPTGLRDVVAHEVAHQWFGDSVTEATWADLWLSEGFATYFEGLFIEKYEGGNEFRSYMKTIAEKYFAYEMKSRTPIHDKETEGLKALLNSNVYDKGAWVLHMLRGVVGEKAFFQGLRDYYAKYRDSTATSEDLRAVFENVSGKDLKWFFTQWIYNSGHPSYVVMWKWIPSGNANSSGTVELEIRQTQRGDAFQNLLIIELRTPVGPQRTTVTPVEKHLEISIPAAHEPIAITLDPDQFVLKDVTYIRQD